MQRLWKKYRPRTLSDVVGQPPVQFLQRVVANPYSSCWCLEGPPGVGKTAAALAMAADLGCYDKDTFPYDDPPDYHFGHCTGLFVELGSEMRIERTTELFGRTLRTRYGSKSGFVVLAIEEMEYLSPQTQTYLKTALEKELPKNVIVIATSNDTSKLMKALLGRFKRYTFSAGPGFMAASQERLRWIWAQECPGVEFPPLGYLWGIDGTTGEFSLRDALSSMEDHVALFAPECVGGAA